jgi:hypothetical protein
MRDLQKMRIIQKHYHEKQASTKVVAGLLSWMCKIFTSSSKWYDFCKILCSLYKLNVFVQMYMYTALLQIKGIFSRDGGGGARLFFISKGQYREIFDPRFFSSIIANSVTDLKLNYFRVWLRICRDIANLCDFPLCCIAQSRLPRYTS